MSITLPNTPIMEKLNIVRLQIMIPSVLRVRGKAVSDNLQPVGMGKKREKWTPMQQPPKGSD
jgi:hypothetical protein